MIIIYVLISIALFVYIISQLMWMILNYKRCKEEIENIIYVRELKEELKNNGEFY